MGFRNAFRRQTTDNAVTQVDMNMAEDRKGDPGAAAENNGIGNEMETPKEDLQRGVQDIEAMTATWSKWALIAVFIKCVFSFSFPPRHALRGGEGIHLIYVLFEQHLVPLSHQRIPKLDSLQLNPLSHKPMGIPLAVKHHLHSRGRHNGSMLHSSCESRGSMGSSRGFPFHGDLRYCGVDYDGCV